VSLEIRRGQVVALVGENGSGKTTIAKLLAGLYTPTSGAITWDGVDVATMDAGSLRSSVGVLFQDFVKYALTAAENIGVGRTERTADDGAVRSAARRAGAESFILRLKDGYATQLGAQYWGGSELSIGQWQRLAMARAFFRDAPLLILDEPTASLDPRAEAQLFEDIRELYRGRTVVVISHRFSSVRTADRIYVLAEGKVVEEGDHKSLMEQHGLYAELYTMQASAFGPATSG
jgi:ATP-binding cassette, subfamily B, bacterial